MLREVEEKGLEHIVSWQHDGRSFRVHNPEKFVDTILPSHFRCSKMKSFQRQLNFYNFRRVVGGSLEGSYMHPSFIKGEEQLAATIKRLRRPTKSSEVETSSKAEPDNMAVNGDDNSVTGDDPHDFWQSAEDIEPEVEKTPDDHRDNLQIFLENSYGGMDFGRRESFREGKRFSFVGKNFFFLPVEFTDLHELSNE